MNKEQFYLEFPGTIIYKEDRGYFNLGYGKYTEFQIYPDETMEVVYCLFGELTDEQAIGYEEYLKIINELINEQ